jgi:hypothetical protein
VGCCVAYHHVGEDVFGLLGGDESVECTGCQGESVKKLHLEGEEMYNLEI